MKKLIYTTIIAICFGQSVLSQNSDHIKGGLFSKIIEYNILCPGVTEADNMYNLKSKSTIDRLFFGETNSPIEYVMRTSFRGASGLRMIKDASDGYRIEVINMPDCDKIVKIVSKKEKEVDIPFEFQSSIPLDVMARINEYNNQVNISNINGDTYKPYRKELESFKISKTLAIQLYNKMVSLIYNFKAIGLPPIVYDGNQVTFRCVAGDELWTLTIHCPQKRALQLSNLCNQIITDSKNNQLNESAYLKLLDQIDL